MTRRITALRYTRSRVSPRRRKRQPASRVRVCAMAPTVLRMPAVRVGQRAAEHRQVGDLAPGVALQLAVRVVQVDEHLDRQRLADAAGVVARLPERVQHGVRVAGIEGQPVGQGRRERLGRAPDVGGQLGAGQDGLDLLPLGARQVLVEAGNLGGQLLGDQEQPGDVLAALEVAAHPVEAVRHAGEDHASRSASTQVSLLPPPWDELTTYEPGRRATRVSPPGRTRMRSP